eukprot:Rhum_TRINITY_DN15083_c0_g1::Rhum_TRINITY_DN15083_c0_g1_i1::g.136346::m.136346
MAQGRKRGDDKEGSGDVLPPQHLQEDEHLHSLPQTHLVAENAVRLHNPVVCQPRHTLLLVVAQLAVVEKRRSADGARQRLQALRRHDLPRVAHRARRRDEPRVVPRNQRVEAQRVPHVVFCLPRRLVVAEGVPLHQVLHGAVGVLRLRHDALRVQVRLVEVDACPLVLVILRLSLRSRHRVLRRRVLRDVLLVVVRQLPLRPVQRDDLGRRRPRRVVVRQPDELQEEKVVGFGAAVGVLLAPRRVGPVAQDALHLAATLLLRLRLRPVVVAAHDLVACVVARRLVRLLLLVLFGLLVIVVVVVALLLAALVPLWHDDPPLRRLRRRRRGTPHSCRPRDDVVVAAV